MKTPLIRHFTLPAALYAASVLGLSPYAHTQDGYGCIGPGYFAYEKSGAQTKDANHSLVLYTPPTGADTTPTRRTYSLPNFQTSNMVCEGERLIIIHDKGRLHFDMKTGTLSPEFTTFSVDELKPAINLHDARQFLIAPSNQKAFVETLPGWPAEQGFELHILYYSVPLYDAVRQENHGLTHYTISRIVKNPPSGMPSAPKEIPLYSGAIYEAPDS